LLFDQTQQNKDNHQQFYPKIRNLSNIQFTENEIQLLNKGLNFNLRFKQKHSLKTLGLEAETAISYANESEQNCLRHAVSKTIEHFIKKNQNW
jgi:hypothetical protein